MLIFFGFLTSEVFSQNSHPPVDEFKNYALVIIAHSQERPYDEKEHAQIAEYLEKGGHLLLLNQAPKSLATPASLPALRNWLGMDTRRMKTPLAGEVKIADDGFLSGIIPKRKIITAQPLGHVYGDVNDAAPAVRFERNLRDLGFEWTLINILRPSTFLIGDAGKLTHVYTKENLTSIISDSPPVIDFSSMDAHIDSAVDHNFTYFIVTGKVSSSINKLCLLARLSEAEEME